MLKKVSLEAENQLGSNFSFELELRKKKNSLRRSSVVSIKSNNQE